MVNHCWAICNLCNENVVGILKTWVPVCSECNVDIENFYFHEDCVYKIFDQYRGKVVSEYKDKFKFACELCLTTSVEFDNISLDSVITYQ